MDTRKSIVIISIFCIVILGIVGTYAYFSTNVSSREGALTASSAHFELSLEIIPIYYYTQLIPMDDNLAVTGYNNGCIDDNDFEVCQAYTIRLGNIAGTGQKERLLGVINFALNRVTNLKFMLLDENSNIYVDSTTINNNQALSLGDYVELDDGEDKEFTLIIWLHNLDRNQNGDDANGSFTAAVTYTGVTGSSLSTSITGTVN